MEKHITKFVLALGVFMAGLLGLSRVEDVQADQLHMKVTPVSFEYDLDPGSKQSGSFTVMNEGSSSVYYQAEAKPYFIADKEGGGIDVSYDKESTHTQIANWVKFDVPSGEIAPNSSIEVNFTIEVPEDAPGGGQYTALMVSNSETKPDSNGISISEVANIGPVVYAKVSGNTIAKGEILSNEIEGFRFEPPISASATVRNDGNVHADVTYTMHVYPLFGGESIYNNEDRPARTTVLPGTTRFYTVSWTADQGAPSVGIYKVQSEVKMFDQVSNIEKIVIICPMWVLIIITIFILALIFWIISRVKARKAEA